MLRALRELDRQGQSVWLDGLTRGLLRTGELDRLADEGVRGLTTNPALYEKAIAGTSDYDQDIAALGARGLPARTIYEQLAVEDLRDAADRLRRVWDATGGRDGYVSLEVSPEHAHDARATIEEARRLWEALARPNAMIKVPATPEGIRAIAPLAAAGLNLNVTLLFSRAAYRAAAEAWLSGLEDRRAAGEDVSRAASVASFFVSRVDTLIDRRLDALAALASDPQEQRRIRALRGEAAVANAKLAYRDFRELLATRRFAILQEAGARPQRVLWASTSVKDPAYPALKYVEALVGPHTVDTLPRDTYDAVRKGADVSATLLDGVERSEEVIASLRALGVAVDEVTDALLADGVRQFVEAFDRLLGAVAERSGRRAAGSGR